MLGRSLEQSLQLEIRETAGRRYLADDQQMVR